MPFIRLNALDWINFLLADVRGGLGTYVIVYLVTQAHWSQATVGAVLTISGLTGILLHPFVGAWIDSTRAKRAALIAATMALPTSGLAIILAPITPVVFLADVTMAILGGIFAPVVAAISVGLVKKPDLPTRLGRNAAFDRAGNVFVAVIVGILGTLFSQKAPFLLLPLFAGLTIVAILSIPASAIDHDKARGLAAEDAPRLQGPEGWRSLLKCRPLVVFSIATAVFSFANAPLLQLVAQKLAFAHPGYESGLTSAAIIVTQLASIPMALLVMRANNIGRKPLLIVALAAVPIRAILCSLWDDPDRLLAVQLLDGAGAGLFDAMLPLMLADMMRGTGRYSLARGVVSMVGGIGGSVGQGAAGLVASRAGYGIAFLFLAGVGMIAVALAVAAIPAEQHPVKADSRSDAI